MKIEEMKDTAANRDVNSGGTSNVTAAAAIAALQEAGNKASRDMIAASYRAYTQINTLCVELMRQFYDVSRSFRITGEGNEYQFVDFDNAGLQDQVTGLDTLGNEMYRRPVFDLKIKAQKRIPSPAWSRTSGQRNCTPWAFSILTTRRPVLRRWR